MIYGNIARNILVTESKKIIGYHGTKSIEKKYNIPDKYCIEWKELRNSKKGDEMIIDKIKGAVKYIKDDYDVNAYFGAILQRLFYRNYVTSPSILSKYSVISKIYDLYSQNYKGDDKISKNDLYDYVKSRVSETNRNVALATGASQTVIF